MGRDDRRWDDWGQDNRYDRGGYGDRYGERDRYGDRDRYQGRNYGGYGRDRYDDRRRDDRYGGYGDRYGGRDRRDRYGGGGGGGYRDRRNGRGGGFRGRNQDHFKDRREDEIDEEELEYIRKRQEVLKARREQEENYVAEEIDTEALAAMGLPTGFGPPPKAEEEEGRESRDHDRRHNGDHDEYGRDRKERSRSPNRVRSRDDRHGEDDNGERDEKRRKREDENVTSPEEAKGQQDENATSNQVGDQSLNEENKEQDDKTPSPELNQTGEEKPDTNEQHTEQTSEAEPVDPTSGEQTI